MNIKILGSGCPKCRELARVADSVADEMGLDHTLEKVTGIDEIVSYGVMITPALVIDGRVVLSGRVPSTDEMRGILEAAESQD